MKVQLNIAKRFSYVLRNGQVALNQRARRNTPSLGYGPTTERLVVQVVLNHGG
jgi:hypothetical protein